MRQCRLRKGNKEQVAWIDAKKSDIGKFVDFKIDGESYRNWKIVKVCDPEMTKEQVFARSQDYRNQRRASDI